MFKKWAKYVGIMFLLLLMFPVTIYASADLTSVITEVSADNTSVVAGGSITINIKTIPSVNSVVVDYENGERIVGQY